MSLPTIVQCQVKTRLGERAKKCKLAPVRGVFSGLRGRYALALAAGACSSAAPYVTPPMTASTVGLDASRAEPSDLDARAVYRPLPPEPAAPGSGCKREATCQPEADEPPPLAFPPPFERCLPTTAKGAFSPKSTRDARIDDLHACCYAAFRGCR
jgi:hypothetical protein